ncbi:hypothetical protein GL218_03372 [Daldinia childiae]|uniref:uncharacterized protein n=1 Tax=Daldinia childiae TaxID=326645 RepID=UPI0014474FB6|nr:uncharacterized protein GL218_03372 [Daldinia childiae]KAF3062438.1 hypothetical protein GL218_03372 [Daldinia childiae]
MASPQLAIARVSFSAVLLRPDPTSCSRGEIDEFLQLLDATISRCSPPNVQKSKHWILKNLVQSPIRITALGKYLTAVAKSFNLDLAASRQAREPSSKRKRLHILYVLNDALYHVHIRDRNTNFAQKLELAIPDIIQLAAAFPNCPKHSKKVLDLIDLWGEKQYFSETFIQKLRTTAQEAPHLATKVDTTIDGTQVTGTRSSKDAPFIMPAMHGDATVSWYDLPAANWLPAIEPNSTRPMNPDIIKPLQFVAGPADEKLVKAVQDLLVDVDRIYSRGQRDVDQHTEDIDQLGQRVVLDEITGDVVDGDSYYGWSRAFCEKMKQRRKKTSASGDGHRGRGAARSHSRSRSSSRSSSRPAHKRRREIVHTIVHSRGPKEGVHHLLRGHTTFLTSPIRTESRYLVFQINHHIRIPNINSILRLRLLSHHKLSLLYPRTSASSYHHHPLHHRTTRANGHRRFRSRQTCRRIGYLTCQWEGGLYLHHRRLDNRSSIIVVAFNSMEEGAGEITAGTDTVGAGIIEVEAVGNHT